MKPLVLLATIAAAVASQGCVMVGPVTHSRPTLADGTHDRFETDALGYQYILKLERLALSVTPRNARTWIVFFGPLLPILPFPGGARSEGLDYGPPFVFDLQLYPEEEGFSFDPGRVTLEISLASELLSPEGFVGPFSAGVYWGHREYPKYLRGNDGICGVKKPPSWAPSSETLVDAEISQLTMRRPMQRHEVKEAQCFGLFFAIASPSPDQQFQLRIEGLQLRGQPFPVPPIRFDKARGWEADTL